MIRKSIWVVVIAGSIAAIAALFSTFALSPLSPSTIRQTTDFTATNSSLLNEVLERSITTTVLENGTKVTSFRNPSGFDKDMLQAYIEMKSAELKQLSSEQPDKEVMAAVSFKQPMTQAEIDELVAQHSLKVDYFEYVATNNVSGGVSTIVVPNLEKAQEGQTHGTIIGTTYILAFGKAFEFEKLNEDKANVILADIAFFLEIEEARSQGGIAYSPNIPRNLYQESRSLDLLATEPQQ